MKAMEFRTTHREVTLANPFTLAGIDGLQRPGTYRISTDEEELATPNHLGYRRVATAITLPSAGRGLEQHAIDPVELEAALLRDAGMAV
jgi:hypothetical protein